jgi:DNA-binding beta-propeller fold protein YncE
MVQCILTGANTSKLRSAAGIGCLIFLLIAPASAGKRQKANAEPSPPDLLLEGGRKLSFERTFSSERDTRAKPGFWGKVINVVAGEPDYKQLVRPYGVAVDSRRRLIVSDPGRGGVHIFDAQQHKYKFIERQDKGKDPMLEPQCVAVDARDNIYVTDSKAGKVFVFEPSGKYQGVLGSLKGGEGYFKRPTGIAIDSATQRIYVTDTLRDRVYVLDPQGRVLRTIGKHGSGDGEFNFPTELRVKNGVLAVVDAMNFRVQMFDAADRFLGAIGNLGDSSGQVFRPKGIAIDSEDHIYLVEGLWGAVQVFDRQGQLLYSFGHRGTRLGEFQLPAGLFIDNHDTVYVVDSYNRRVQVFQYHALRTKAGGAGQ